MKVNRIAGWALLAAVAAAPVFFTGCAKPLENKIRITAIMPDPDVALFPGDTLSLEVTVEYSLKDEKGRLGLVVQTDDNTPVANQSWAVERGADSSTFRKVLLVPETGELSVYTSLTPGQGTKTNLADRRVYRVSGRK